MAGKTTEEAGWKYSEYNLFARVPDTDKVAWLNTLSGSCSEFSNEEYLLTQRVLDLPEDHEYIRHYASRGLIVNFDEKEELRRRFTEGCEKTDTLYLTVCPTLACNFDCPYCFETHIPGMMKPEVMDDIVSYTERMLERHPFKKVFVVWFGGEPLLGIDIIEMLSQRLIHAAEAHDVEYSAEIITNGYLFDEHAVEVLTRGNVIKGQITLDGLAEAHNKTRCLAGGQGTFETIADNLRRQKIPFPIDIRHNVTQENRSEIEPLKAFVEELAQESGNDLVYYSAPVFDSDAAKERNREVSILCKGEDSEFIYKDAFDTFCSTGFSLCEAAKRYSITIDHEGKIYCCCEKAGVPDEVLGYIKNYDPDRYLETSSNPKLTEYYKTFSDLFKRCGDCVFLPRCKGECPAKRRTNGPDCPQYKEDPDSYVLRICQRLKEMKKEKETAGKPDIKTDSSADSGT